MQTLSNTESEPDQTKEVVEPLEKSKPVKKRAASKPKLKSLSLSQSQNPKP